MKASVDIVLLNLSLFRQYTIIFKYFDEYDVFPETREKLKVKGHKCKTFKFSNKVDII